MPHIHEKIDFCTDVYVVHGDAVLLAEIVSRVAHRAPVSGKAALLYLLDEEGAH